MNQKGFRMSALRQRRAGKAAKRAADPTNHLTAALLLALLTGMPAGLAQASDGAQACLHSAKVAARTHGIPADLMRRLAADMSGKRQGPDVQPWPWTVGQAGQRHWFSDAESAVAYIEQLRDSGQEAFDVGCFQVAHPAFSWDFASPVEMLDPAANAESTARRLAAHFRDTGSWEAALAALADVPQTSVSQTPPNTQDEALPVMSDAPASVAVSAGTLGSLIPTAQDGQALSLWPEIN